ncbi:exodeoxyribonuclease I [Endozoicomonas sp. OPT23]|nr:exodeoxyribonuclease I [Endozoicomonas sp. OPT23]
MRSFYWLDYETFGTNPSTDWPSQFAGIRTDADLNEIGEPLNIYCRQPVDHLPHPVATLVTGLTPQKVNSEGLIEPDFISRINEELLQPGTCAAGYNSIRFDDEVTRNCLYRNFHDPYAREWQNGNSRWDLIDLVRMTAALRPEGINWPKNDDGFNSYRLEKLTEANGISHGQAHDALADVRATIALARLIKEKQPKLFSFYLELRNKQAVAQQLNLVSKNPVVHISGMFGAARLCTAVVMPLAVHPVNKNGVMVYDLSADPTPLLELSIEELQYRLFTPLREQEEGAERIPLKTVHLNKCPAVAPLKVLTAENRERLSIDLELCKKHHQILLNHPVLAEKIQAIFSSPKENDVDDPDQMIYSGGFFSRDDKGRMDMIRSSAPEKLSRLGLSFGDRRLDEMLFRYRGRHFPETLDSEEQEQWQSYCRERLSGKDPKIFGFEAFDKALNETLETASSKDRVLLQELREYRNWLQQQQG